MSPRAMLQFWWTCLLLAGCSSTTQSSGDCRSGAFACQCSDGTSGTCGHVGNGYACVCQPPFDAGSTADAISWTPSAFAGRWSPLSGSGEETCTDGESTALPPDTSAVITITQDSPSTLTTTPAVQVPGCSLELSFAGDTASLATPNQTCTIPGTGGVLVYYNQFDLAFLTDDAGTPGDGGIIEGGGGADSGADDASPAPDSGAADAGATSASTLDWHLSDQFTDSVKTCTTTLHYTLVRAQ